MKKAIATIFSFLFVALAASYSQKQTYRTECGKKVSSVIFDTVVEGDAVKLTVHYGTQLSTFNLDGQYRTKDWHLVDNVQGTDLTVKYDGKTFTMKGKFKGEAVDKTWDGKGYPWYQHIAYSAGHFMKGGTVTYNCVRPTDMDFFTMTATDMGEVDFRGMHVVRLKVAPTGAFAKLWSCDYYYDPQTHFFAGYKGVEGGPGTPATYWILEK